MQAIIYRMDKQQGPTVYMGNYIHYPVINCNEKEYKKECVYTYNYHFFVQQKLIHCKSTALKKKSINESDIISLTLMRPLLVP